MPTENNPVPFEREERYIVLKLNRLAKDEAEYLRDCQANAMVDCVVVEHDWPEYHLVWAMIEHRMAGKPVPDFNLWRRADELQQRIDELTGARTDRSPKDYAIEHAEYMAKSADDVLAKFQAYGLALLAVDEGGDDGEGELFENIDSARGDLQESLVELRGMVYEFRKRSTRLNTKS